MPDTPIGDSPRPPDRDDELIEAALRQEQDPDVPRACHGRMVPLPPYQPVEPADRQADQPVPRLRRLGEAVRGRCTRPNRTSPGGPWPSR